MWKKYKDAASATQKVVDVAFNKALSATGAVADSETVAAIKQSALSAVSTAQSIAKNMSDLNGDGKIDAEDLKIAAQKAGIAWDRIDQDLKAALLAGGAAGIGVNFIPLIGQAVAIPAFVGTTAYFYIAAKLRKVKLGPESNAATNRSDDSVPDSIPNAPRHHVAAPRQSYASEGLSSTRRDSNGSEDETSLGAGLDGGCIDQILMLPTGARFKLADVHPRWKDMGKEQRVEARKIFRMAVNEGRISGVRWIGRNDQNQQVYEKI